MHIDIQTLAEQAKVQRNTITRAPGSRGVQDYLREALRVIKAANDLSGDLGKALFWYRNEPLSVFDYKTSERLVSEGRTDDVLRYVASLEAGLGRMGRANRPGVATPYLSLEPETAMREYQQLSPLVPPGTLVSYTVNVAKVIDFRGGYVAGIWSPLWEKFYCDWRELWFNKRI